MYLHVFFFFFVSFNVKGHILISITWYPKSLPFDLLKNILFQLEFLSDKTEMNELFNISHAEV